MKYAQVALLLAGVLSTNQAVELSAERPHNNQLYATGLDDSEINMPVPASAYNVQLDAAPCVYLDETTDELEYQVDMFSRTLDPRHWTNALNINKAIGHPELMHVHTWELYDSAFSFPRVRRYGFVQDNMDMLEHFQDNLNTNISNSTHMANFLRVANTVRNNLNTRYHDGEFADPALTDPRED